MSRITKQDTNGVKPLLAIGELGYDNYPTGGDVGRVYVGTGTENIALAKKTEVIGVDGKADAHIARVDNPHNVTKAQVGLANAENTADSAKNVLSATKLTTARTINGVSFDGTANITIADSTKVVANTAITAGTGTKITYDAKGLVTSSTTLSASDIPTLNQNTTGSSGSCTGNAATATNVAWSGVTSKPTTLSGYGITDAQATLVSGTNIKTINSNSLLGSGNVSIGVSGLSDTSISSPLSGQILSYNGVNWVNSGELTSQSLLVGPTASHNIMNSSGGSFTTFPNVIKGSSAHRSVAFDSSSTTSSVWWAASGVAQFAIDSIAGGGADIWINNTSSWAKVATFDKNGGFYQTTKPIISGRMGSAMTNPAGAQILKFDQFWVSTGITYNTNGRFTVPIAGRYRITLNPFFATGTSGGRVIIGINNDAPNVTTCYGHSYRESATYDTGCLNSVVNLAANDWIVFYLYQGQLYNQSSDRFNDFTIEFLG